MTRVVMLDVDELERIVRSAVRTELAERDLKPENATAEYMDARAVAQLLHVHPRTVTRLAAREGLPSIRATGGKLLRFKRSEVLEWMKRRTNAARKESAA